MLRTDIAIFFLSDIRSYFTDVKIGWKTLSLRITSRERLKGHIETKSEEKRGGEKKKKKKEKKTRDIFEVPISPFIRSSQMERGK